jgi:hypothetical protein
LFEEAITISSFFNFFFGQDKNEISKLSSVTILLKIFNDSIAKGLEDKTFSCDFFIFTVEISSIAFVIFQVLETDFILCFISFQEAI